MIQDFRNKHKGIDKTCVIIGNGPSLNQTPLDKLAKYPTFGANKIYTFPFKPTYWTCIDMDMAHDCIPWLIEHPEYRPEIFLPRYVPFPGAHFLNVVPGTAFSRNAENGVDIGGTVTFVNLQLAFYMGFETVLLVGVDHDYPRRGNDGQPGSKFIADDDVDTAHFRTQDGTPYFVKGRIYNRPELEAVEQASYPNAHRAFFQDGRRIINLTPGTKLNTFPKEDFKKWVST